jgi:hypothetical protein
MGRKMKLISTHYLWTLSLLLALTMAAPASADTAGSVIFAKGAVTAERLPPVSLTKGDAVLTEDTIVTGAGARAQLLMIDGAKIAIRPDSRLKIEEYAYGKSASSGASSSITTAKDSSVTSLIKGGFRSITGAIGKADETAYEVRTPVGVLGIRGTDYMAVFCRGDCASAPGASPGEPIEDGLYLGVIEGTIFFRNEFGEFDIRAGEYAFISLADRTLRQLSDPAAVFFDSYNLTAVEDGEPLRFDGKLGLRREPEKAVLDDDGSENSTQDESDSPAQPVIGVDPDGNPIDITPGDSPAQGDRTIGFSIGSLGPQATPFVGVLDNSPDQYQTDAGNNIVGFASAYPPDTNSVVPIPRSGDYGIGTNTLSDTGFDSLTVLRWGRWSGGTVDVTLGNGTDASQDLAGQSLHWISGPENGVPVMPILGAVSYSLVGATSPTDNFGNIGVLGDASFSADFTRQIVSSDLSLTIGGDTWNATGTGTIGAAGNVLLLPHLFFGNYSNVEIDGAAGGTGAFSGFFSDPGPSARPDVPGGVGLTYTLRDESGATEVSGVAAFGNPQ